MISSQDSIVTLLVTGANGQLGSELKVISSRYPEFKFWFLTREEFPLENKEVVSTFFKNHKLNYCINCAAYTAVDKAESEKEKAFLTNGTAVGSLAEICKSHQTKLIHISTDYVYEGSTLTPLKEEDPTDPVGVYGRSKLEGEGLALEKNTSALIIRTSWVYSSFGNNFVKTMLRLFKEKKEINVVSDQQGCPTYARDLAETIMRFIEEAERGKDFSGIVNYSNEGVTNWYEFAEEIKSITGSNCIIHPIPTSSYPTPAKRPLYSVLDTSKIKSLLNLKIPHWKDSLKKCLQTLNAQSQMLNE